MNNYLILIVGFTLVSEIYCSDKPKKLAKLQDDFWGEQISSPQVSQAGDLIGHHEVGQDSSESQTKTASSKDLSLQVIALERKNLSIVDCRPDSAVDKLKKYKQAVGVELIKLEKSLEAEGFDFEGLSLSREAISPRARIKAITRYVKEAKMVEEAVESNRKKMQNKWPSDKHKLFGSSITSMYECHDLVRQLGSNDAFRIFMYSSFLVGLYLYRKKGN